MPTLDGSPLSPDDDLGAVGSAPEGWTEDQTLELRHDGASYTGAVSSGGKAVLRRAGSNLEMHVALEGRSARVSCLRTTKDRDGLTVVRELSLFD